MSNLDYAKKRLRMEATFAADEGQVAVGVVMMQANDGNYTVDAHLATSVSGGVFAASVSASSRTKNGLRTSAEEAAAIDGILQTSHIHHDQLRIEMSFQVRGTSSFSVKTKPTVVQVKVAAVGSIHPIQEARIACDGSSSNGIYHGFVSLHENFCDTLSNEQQLEVSYQLISPETSLPASIARKFNSSVTALPTPKVSMDDIMDTTFVRVPSHELVSGETFEIEIVSRFKHYLNNAGLKFTVGANLLLSNIRLSPAFSTASFDLSDSKVEVSALFAGRKDAKPVEEQVYPTDEVLLTATVTVATTSESETGNLRVTLLRDLRDQEGGQLTVSSKYGFGVIYGRDGVVYGQEAAAVYLKENGVAGIFAFAQSSAELINTAKVSGNAMFTEIAVVGVRLRQQEVMVQHTSCASGLPSVLGVDGACRAVLNGDEESGAREAHVRVTYKNFKASVPFRVFALMHNSFSMTISQSTARAVAGSYDMAHEGCSMLNYQVVDVTATASFSDGEDEIKHFDVSRLLRLRSSHPDIIEFGSTRTGGPMITVSGDGRAKINGNVIVTVVASAGTEGAYFPNRQLLQVYDQSPLNRIAVIGLDAVVFSELGDLHVTPDLSTAYSRNTFPISFSVTGYKTRALAYEGDAMNVVVYAVLEDKSRIEITPADGLILDSLVPESITVDPNGSRLVVPYDPLAAAGPLVSARWNHTNDCQASHGGFISAFTFTNISLSVEPPLATAMSVVTNLPKSRQFLVPLGDPAAEVGFWTSIQLVVTLSFPSKTVHLDASDTRVEYAASDGAPFAVDSTGFVTANSAGVTGEGFVIVRFAGQVVNATVAITVARYERLVTTALPYPSYSGSQNVDASTLAPIKCTEPTLFQQAKLVSTMVLTNDAKTNIAPNRLNFEIMPGTADPLLNIANGIVSTQGAGSASVAASLKVADGLVAANAPVLEISVRTEAVLVTAISNFRLGNRISTFSGTKDTTQQWLSLGVTLSDGRQYPAMLRNGKSMLPGLVTYNSSVPSAASVNAVTGRVTLRGNHYEAVSLDAVVCPAGRNVPGRSILVSCNLQASVGDVDLGSSSGSPLAAKSLGDSFTLPVRINTGSGKLQLFSMQLLFDSETIEYVSHSPGSAVSSLQLGNDGDSIAAAGEVKSNAGAGVLTIFSVTFKVIKVPAGGLSGLTGVVNELIDYRVDDAGNGLLIGTPSAAFEAGQFDFIVGTGHSDQRWRRGIVSRGRRGTSSTSSGTSDLSTVPLLRGDANCDGKYNLQDAKRIIDYVLGSYADFSTSLGKSTKAAVEACQRVREEAQLPTAAVMFMDPDGDGMIAPSDLTFLLTVEIGALYFTHVTAFTSACSLTIDVLLATKDGTAPRPGTRVLVDVAYGEDGSYALNAALQGHTANVASSSSGTLVEASASPDAPYRYSFSLNADGAVPFQGVGLSIVQLVTAKLSTKLSWQLFSTFISQTDMAAGSVEYTALSSRWNRYGT